MFCDSLGITIGISYKRSSPKIDATIAETVWNLKTTQINNDPNCSLSCTVPNSLARSVEMSLNSGQCASALCLKQKHRCHKFSSFIVVCQLCDISSGLASRLALLQQIMNKLISGYCRVYVQCIFLQ